MKRSTTLIALFLCLPAIAIPIRLKDLATIRGMKDNQLFGYGIVVGLPGTGDRGSEFTETTLNMALKSLGVDPKIQKVDSKNTAATIVSAILPPFAKAGAKLDVVVASIGSASSLEGGTLMMTPLKGADGKVYAIAQGRITVTRRAERGTAAYQSMLSSSIPEAAILEKDVAFDFADLKELHYSLFHPDFTTAARIAKKINMELAGKFATASDPGTVDIILPYALDETPVELVARLEGLEIEPDHRAKVVVNRKTGAVVLGQDVVLLPSSLAHSNLRVIIQDGVRKPSSEPDPNSPRDVPVPVDSALIPSRVTRKIEYDSQPTSVADIVTSLNEVGSNADDIVFVIQSLQSTGSLIADVEFK